MPKSGANLSQHEPSLFGAGDSKLDEEFFDMVVLMQGSRLEDQRSPAAADKKHGNRHFTLCLTHLTDPQAA